jgi:hypothetical protein
LLDPRMAAIARRWRRVKIPGRTGQFSQQPPGVMCACRQERGSSKRSAALCPHYLVNNRKIVTAGPTPISTLSMLTSCGVMAMKSPTLAVLVAGAAIDLMPVSASALCVPPRGGFMYGIPAVT